MSYAGIAQQIMADPESYSKEQLESALNQGLIPAYVAIPLIEQKAKEAAAFNIAELAAQAPQQNAPTVAEEVLARANQPMGMLALASNLPKKYAPGGIVAFDDGGEVDMAEGGIVALAAGGSSIDEYLNMAKKFLPEARPELTLPELFNLGKESRAMYGIDEDLYKTQKAEIEKEKTDLQNRRDAAYKNRWIEAGLKMLGSKSPYFGGALAEAAPSVAGYGQDIKDINALDSALRKESQLLARDQDKALRTQSASDIAQVQKRKDDMYAAEIERGKLAGDLYGKQQQRDTTLEAARIGVSKPTEIESVERLVRAAAKGDKVAAETLSKVAEIKAAGGYGQQGFELKIQNALRDIEEDETKFNNDSKYAQLKVYTKDNESYKNLSPETKRRIDNLQADFDAGKQRFQDRKNAIRSIGGLGPPTTAQTTPAAPAAPAAKPAAAATKPRVTYGGKTYEFATQDQADAFKKAVS